MQSAIFSHNGDERTRVRPEISRRVAGVEQRLESETSLALVPDKPAHNRPRLMECVRYQGVRQVFCSMLTITDVPMPPDGASDALQ